MTHKNFSGVWIKNCTVKASIFFKLVFLLTQKKILKIHMDSEKTMNLFQMKKKIGYLNIY